MTYTANRAVRPATRFVSTLLLGCFAVALLAPRVLTLAADAQLPKELRTAPQPDRKPIIDQINKCVELLKSENPADQAKGRDMLVAETGPVGVAQPSPGFLYIYAGELNKALAAAPVSKHSNFRVRLNAAVAATRVAERASNRELAEAVVAFLNDANEGVALWGMKGAKFVLKDSLAQGAGGPAVIPPMIATALKFPSTAAAAYDSLKVNDPTLPVPTVTALIKGTQDLLDARLKLYQKGIPPEPAAELVATSTLPDCWKQHPANLKPITVQLLVNLGALSGPLVGIAQNGETADQLKQVLRNAGAAIVAVSIPEGKDLQNPMKPVLQVNNRSNPQQCAAASALIYPETKKAFTSVVAPPAGPGGTGPATAPTSAATAAGGGK